MIQYLLLFLTHLGEISIDVNIYDRYVHSLFSLSLFLCGYYGARDLPIDTFDDLFFMRACLLLTDLIMGIITIELTGSCKI